MQLGCLCRIQCFPDQLGSRDRGSGYSCWLVPVSCPHWSDPTPRIIVGILRRGVRRVIERSCDAQKLSIECQRYSGLGERLWTYHQQTNVSRCSTTE